MRVRRFEITGGGEPSAKHKLQSFQTRGLGRTGDEAGRERDDDVPLLAQLGVLARPVVRRGLRALGLVDGSNVTLLGLFDRAISHETAPAAGETRVYATGAPKVCVRLLGGLLEIRVETGGVVKIAPDVGEAQLAPGGAEYAGQSVARNGDIVNPSAAMVTWMAAVNAAIPMPSPAPPATIGTITGSTSRAKA